MLGGSRRGQGSPKTNLVLSVVCGGLPTNTRCSLVFVECFLRVRLESLHIFEAATSWCYLLLKDSLCSYSQSSTFYVSL